VTLDLDVRKEIFPDFLERLRTDLHVATGHQAGDFRIKTLLPDDTHSGMTSRTSAVVVQHRTGPNLALTVFECVQ
jgi:hypothetical protein